MIKDVRAHVSILVENIQSLTAIINRVSVKEKQFLHYASLCCSCVVLLASSEKKTHPQSLVLQAPCPDC